MKKLIFIALSFTLMSFALQAQKPEISGITPASGTVNTTVVISGTNLPTGAAAHVQFGAAQGTVLEATSSQIKAAVPAGASYSKITVTNKSNGLAAESPNPFMLSFGGSGFDATKFAADLPFGPLTNAFGMFDMCSCDFNGDGKVDIATSHINYNSISVYRNTSVTPGEPSFTGASITVNAYSRNIICGDIDGDGLSDIILSGNGQNANRVYYLKNVSAAGGAIAFATAFPLSMISGSAAMLALEDLNADGRPEIIVSNLTTPTVGIFVNNSSPGSPQFTAQEISISGATNTHGISANDFNGDGKPDLALTAFQGNSVYLLRNTSSGSTISFAESASLSSSAGLIGIATADLNGDGKADLAVTNNYLTSNQISVWLNGSSSGNLQFGGLTSYTSGSRPWSIVAADIDGNGKTDLLVHHTQSSSIYVLHNSSTNGSLQLTGTHVVTTEVGRHLNVVDYDGDAKPELAYTGTAGNKLRVLHNRHAIAARLSHSGTITLCAGQTVTLQTTKALGVTYRWTRNGTALATTDPFLTVSEAGDYTVTITSATDDYTVTSETLRVVAGGGTGTSIAMDPITPVCVGGSAVLRATAISGATYVWNGPNSFTATTTSPSYTLNNIQAAAAGAYSVVVKSGDCQFTPAAQSLSVYQNPQPQITAAATSFCAGTSVNLQTQAGFASYQWKLDGANYSGAGATTASITATMPGNYTVVVSNSAGCTAQSAAMAITQTQPPAANFSAPASACLGMPVTFNNTSTYATGQNPTYRWTFGDGGTSTEANPTHTFTLLGNFTVNLTISYGGLSCSNTVSKTIAVVPTPQVELVSPGALSFCPGDSVLLQVSGDASGAQWSNGATGLEIWAKEAGTYTANIQTNAGCLIEKSIAVSHLAQPDISISASATSINLGEEVQLTAGGGLQYEWEAADDIVDRHSHTVRIKPLKTTTYTVSGWNENGCSATAQITIEVDQSLRISPPKVLLPATDGVWSIPNIELYPDLSLTIVNSLGRSIFTAKPYANNWDGTERGNPLEPGVYYYIFKDASGKVVKTGSITLLR